LTFGTSVGTLHQLVH